VAGTLKIIFHTTDDPIYLPAFLERVLSVQSQRTAAVYVVPPLYKEQTVFEAALRYGRTFGLAATAHLTARILQTKLRGQSIASVCQKQRVASAPVPDVNAPDFLARLRHETPDVLVSVSCPQIFKKPLIELPARGILNIHGAILPNYRGVMPSFWMLANGERQAGVSIYFVNELIDAGDLCGQRVFEIPPHETLDQFLRRSKAIAADLLLDVLARIEQGEVATTPLDLSKGSYYSWPDGPAVKQFRASGRRLW
jgi:methionyl-tRNA formyltransferase